jgi:hypothetical protein
MSVTPLAASGRSTSRGIRELQTATGESASMIAVMIKARFTPVQSDVLADGMKRRLRQ